MATRRAVANGNWSATGTWNGGVVPTNGDTVYANGFVVTIDQNIDIGGANNPLVNAGSFVSGQWYAITFVGTTSWTAIGASSNSLGVVFLATGAGSGTGQAQALATLTTTTNTAAGATGGGGQFAMSASYNMTCDLRAGTTTCMAVTGATNLSLSGIRMVAGSAIAFSNSGSGTINLSSVVISGGSASVAVSHSSATGTMSISGSTITAANSSNGVQNSSTGTLTISGSTIIGGFGGAATAVTNNSGPLTVSNCTINGGSTNGGPGIANNSTGTLTISGSTINAGVGSVAITNASTATVIATSSTFTANAFFNAFSIANTAADVRLSGDFLDHWSGWKAVSGGKWRLGTAPTLGQTRFALAGATDSYFTMYGADNGSFGNPIAANVRSGISYGGGNLAGTCAVPAAGSVALGVPVDAGYGTAVLTPEAVWGHASRTITAGGISASDVWDYATRSLTTSSGPTAVQIRQEMDSNSTKLANLDTTVSSRLAPSGTLATVTTLTNAPSVPTPSQIASQVRTELSVELSRVDAAVSSRATAANIPSADIAAIKAKTDSVNVDRINNTATLSHLGNLLAQANS